MTGWRPIAGSVLAAFALAACGNSGSGSGSGSAPQDNMSTSTTGVTASKAADLRTRFNYLLGEHLILASKATGAALGGRNDEFAAYAGQLNQNGTDLGAMVGAAYGAPAQDKFNSIWSAHNGFFVDYTTGVATNDKAMKDKAVQDLTTVYVPQFSDFLAGATGLPKETIAGLTTEHVLTTKQIVDDQGAKNWTAVYADIRKAYAHMQMIGNPVSEAIAKKNAAKFPGDAAGKGVDFRVALNGLLQEHLYLATFATSAALGGRNEEFAAAGKSLNENGTDLGKAIGGIYGAATQDKFNSIWSAHNGFFVDYTTGVAKSDKAMQDKAVSDLTAVYVPHFSDLLAGATALPKGTLASLTKDHVLTTKQVVDDQAAKAPQKTAGDDRAAGQHMEMIGDPLAAAIVMKNASKF